MTPPATRTLYRCEVDGRFLMDPHSFPFDPPGTVRWTRRKEAAREFPTAAEAEAAHPGGRARPLQRNSNGWVTEIDP